MAPRSRFAAITALAVVVVAALAPAPAGSRAHAVPAARAGTAGTGEGCEAEAPGAVAVRVVVDYGDLAEAPDEPRVACVSVPEGADGSEVLAARAEQLGTPPPRYESSGLLCAIDGVPETGCGEPTDTGYRYWSYWLGTAEGWEYASVGPAFRSAEATVSEGWRFVDGAGGPEDPSPDPSPDPAAGAPSASSGSSGSSGSSASSDQGGNGAAGADGTTAGAGDGADGTAGSDSGGTLAGTLAGTAAGVLAVGVLAAAAVVVSRRRST